MPQLAGQPFNIYRDQLSSLYHGVALWEPNPLRNIYDQVSIGDVGYVQDGFFYRMFNVTLPWDDPLNTRFGEPEPYKTLVSDPFTNIREAALTKGDYYSRLVSKEDNAGRVRATGPDETSGFTYKCSGPGALLHLPHDGHRLDVIRTKVFEDYIRDNVVTWFTWAQKKGLGVERMEDLILVSGCTLVTSWAAAVFVDHAEISLAIHPHKSGGEDINWGKIQGPIAHHNRPFDPNPPRDQCVFVRGFRAKRVLFWTKRMRAAAEPRADDADNSHDDEIQISGVPDGPTYRDPLVGVLDYIAEKCPDDCEKETIAIAHDDDLQLIENVETLTASAVETFLRENQMPVLIENGAAILHEDEPPVPDGVKAIFYATAVLGGEPVQLVLHPVLAKYLLKLDLSEPADHDYELPKEETTSPAVYPPMLSLTLENQQGYPQLIGIRASGDSPSVGITVQDVLNTLQEDLRKPLARRQLVRCKTEEDLSKGPCRFDQLGGRNRLQILPKHPAHEELLLQPTPSSAESL
ncbi:hypothetical protein BC827DRAFT_169055 [Russula dissimulans]|nr:hypothetical protein BC827DRAFT_169055 [Russula dissimulans]